MGITIDDAAKHVSSMGLKTSLGAVLLSVRPGSPAHARNLRAGDVIVGMLATRVKRAADVHLLARPLKPGQRFHLIVQRESGIFSFYMQF
jgi:S1-C subfamily serine protease